MKPTPRITDDIDRKTGESKPAYQAFRAYLDLGPDRKLADAADKVGKSVSLLSRWSSRHQWRERIANLNAAAESSTWNSILDSYTPEEITALPDGKFRRLAYHVIIDRVVEQEEERQRQSNETIKRFMLILGFSNLPKFDDEDDIGPNPSP